MDEAVVMRGIVAVVLAGCSIPSEHYTPGSGSAVDAPTCWPIATTNFDPCPAEFPKPLEAFAPQRAVTIDTTSATLIDSGGGNQPMFGTLYNSTDSSVVLLVHVPSILIRTGVTVNVTGMHPLLFVSDTTIAIDGTLDYSETTAPEDDGCKTMTSTQHPFGPGGTGGGFGADGGRGGAGDGDMFPSTTADAANGDNQLSPLRVGCAGARGATGMGLQGGVGGHAGGAVELSAHDSITISHFLIANGGGGGAGLGGDATHDSGGGGGGSGGALLLEAPMIDVEGASLCAVGGGGGPGGVLGTASTDGGDGMICLPGSGGSAGPTAPVGGAGGAAANGQPGGMVGGAGGAGGGGGAGRISLHGNVSGNAAMEKPAAVQL